MNLRRFNELMNVTGKRLLQNVSEWQYFLEFADSYFRNRDILHPVIVEIGVCHNSQKPFYQELLDGRHIGVDIDYHSLGYPDVVGNSHDPKTVEKLKTTLEGRQIDLLFIDGDHSYEDVKADYNMYEPLTKHLIAIHDIYSIGANLINPNVHKFWDEIVEKEKIYPLVIFRTDSLKVWKWQLGIGLVIKGSN